MKLHYNCPTTKYVTVTVEMQGMCHNKCGLMSSSISEPSIEESRSLMNGSTFVQQLGLIIKHPISHVATKVKISALDHSILIADSHIIVKQYPVIINIINNTVKTTIETASADPNHDETAWVRIITDLGFSSKFKFVKKHLDYVITDSSGLTSKAHGLQGINVLLCT